MTKDDAYRLALKCARERLEELEELPCHIDQMTEREHQIAVIACEAKGSLSLIKRILEDGLCIENAMLLCEHGVIFGDWCPECNADYKAAAADPANEVNP